MATGNAQSSQERNVTDEEKQEIVKKFLLRSPPGEIQIVARNLKEILQNDYLFDTVAPGAFKEWNEEQYLVVNFPGGSSDNVIVCKHAEMVTDQYINPRLSMVATINHVQQVCTSVRPATEQEICPDHVEEIRASIETYFQQYVKESYPLGLCAVYYSGWTEPSDGQGSGKIQMTAVITAAKLSPQNYWNGRWKSTWAIDIDMDSLSVELKGRIVINAHYFEEGNVALKTDYDVAESTDIQNVSDCGESLVEVIKAAESQYLGSLDEFYGKLSDWQFKELRRKLPVTRTHFPWNKQHLALAAELKKETGKR